MKLSIQNNKKGFSRYAIKLIFAGLIFSFMNIYSQDMNSGNMNSAGINSGIICGFAGNVPVEGEFDFNTSTLATGSYWSSATQTNQSNWPNPGRIWVAATLYKNGTPDSLRIYYSDNGGVNWNYAYFLTPAFNTDFKAGELDIELVYDGTTVWLFGVAGYTNLFVNRQYSLLFRFNTATNASYSADLLWPGYGTTSNLYYNPRITSDNSAYTSNAYVMITNSFDSTAGAAHIYAAKYCKLTSPFAVSPAVDYSMPGGGIFYYKITAEPNLYLWSDVAYSKSGINDRTFVMCNLGYSTALNIAWSDSYGSSLTNNVQFVFSTPLKSSKMAFNGGSGIGSGMITYTYLGNVPDWDIGYVYTTNAGANWSNTVLDNSPNRTRSVDIQAVRGVNNSFKIAYTMDSASSTYGYYVGGFHSNFTQPNKVRVTNQGVDTAFTKIIAGYKLGGGDDCFAVYSSGPGNNVTASTLCQSTVGIQSNNQIPQEFKLEQNYPNPFNPVTNIKFSIPKSSFVKLVVYDASGKEVEALVNSNLEAGSYSYDFNASGLASGVYFYKIEATGFTEVKKMVLIK